MMLSLPSGLGVGDVVYFNVSILNDEAVEELFENFTVHLNDTARVSTIGTRYAVDMREDEADGEFNLTNFLCHNYASTIIIATTALLYGVWIMSIGFALLPCLKTT